MDEAAPAVAAAPSAFSAPAAGDRVETAVLRAFLAKVKAPQRVQRFCFVVETFAPSSAEPEGTRLLRMVWTTGGRIYDIPLPHPAPSGTGPQDAAWRGEALAWSKSVDLATGVVATQEAVGSSTYLVTRAWADRILDQCRRIGTVVRMAHRRPARS